MSWHSWIAYVVVVTVACLTPGPVVLLVLSQAMARGAARTLWTILGIVAANTVYFALSALGIGAILLTFHELFYALRWIGTAYLVWLGLTDIFGKPRTFTLNDMDTAQSDAHMFTKGFLLQVSNPASWLFFTAVLPPFINTQGPIIPQITLLTVTGNVIEFAVASSYAVAAAQLSRLFMRPSFAAAITRISGVLLITAAIAMAVLQ